jgi:hypothetical protein
MNEEEFYYLDLDFLSDFCAIKSEIEPEMGEEGIEMVEEEEKKQITTGIDIFKYEIIKMCLDKILFSNENDNSTEDFLLKKDQESTASYALAFNTLLSHKIIKKYGREY